MAALQHLVVSLAVGTVTVAANSRLNSCNAADSTQCRPSRSDGEASLLATGQLRRSASGDEHRGHPSEDGGSRSEHGRDKDSRPSKYEKDSSTHGGHGHGHGANHDAPSHGWDTYAGSYGVDSSPKWGDSADSHKWPSQEGSGAKTSYEEESDSHKRPSQQSGAKSSDKWDSGMKAKENEYDSHIAWGWHDGVWDWKKQDGNRMDHDVHNLDWDGKSGSLESAKVKQYDDEGKWDKFKKSGFKKCVNSKGKKFACWPGECCGDICVAKGGTCCQNKKGADFVCAKGDTCCGNACAAKGNFCCEGVKGYEYPVAREKDCNKKGGSDDKYFGHGYKARVCRDRNNTNFLCGPDSFCCGDMCASPTQTCCPNSAGGTFVCKEGSICCGDTCAEEGSKCCEYGGVRYSVLHWEKCDEFKASRDSARGSGADHLGGKGDSHGGSRSDAHSGNHGRSNGGSHSGHHGGSHGGRHGGDHGVSNGDHQEHADSHEGSHEGSHGGSHGGQPWR